MIGVGVVALLGVAIAASSSQGGAATPATPMNFEGAVQVG